MTAPEITAALEALIANTPPPVTVWGVRYRRAITGELVDGTPFTTPAGHIDWCDDEADAREWLAEELADDCLAQLVSITGHVRVHPADATEGGGAR